MTLRAGTRVLPSLPSIRATHIPITYFPPTISVLAPHLDHTRRFVTFLLNDKSFNAYPRSILLWKWK